MAIIVQHKESRDFYAVVGTGYSKHWPPVGFGEQHVWPDGKSMVTLCDQDGVIRQSDPDELIVVSIDGKPVAELFTKRSVYR